MSSMNGGWDSPEERGAICSSAQPEHDAEVEAIVDEIAGEFQCGACGYLTNDWGLVRRAVQAGREPLESRFEAAYDQPRKFRAQRDDAVKRRVEAELRLADAKAEGYREGLEAGRDEIREHEIFNTGFDRGKAEGARDAHEVFDAVLDYEESLLPRKDDRTIFADGEASMVERVRNTLEFVRGGGRLRARGDK